MNIEYNWGREDLKKELISRRKVFNVITFIIFLSLYLFCISGALFSKLFDNKWLLICSLVYIVILFLLLFLTTKIYVFINLKRNDKKTDNAYGKYKIIVSDEDIKVNINNQEIIYKYCDINKLKIYKNKFIIKSKNDKIGLTFKKALLNNDYNKLLDKIKSKIN